MEGIDARVMGAGYLLAALGYFFLTLLLLTAFRARIRGVFLAAASFATVVWAVLNSAHVMAAPLSTFGVFLVEFSFDLIWIIFLSSLIGLGVGGTQFALLRRVSLGVTAAILVAGVALQWAFVAGYLRAGAEQLLIFGQVITSLLVLINVEQIMRNARKQQLRGIKYLCLSIAAIFIYDLVMFSHATINDGISPSLWAARGYVVALLVPPIVVALNRAPDWSGSIFVSRQVVFHTATVVAAGAYLTVIGLAGQYIRQLGGSWGGVAQIVFVSVAVVSLGAFFFSERFRLRLRVFISKHFYRNKYDYRQEWLRMTATMTSGSEAIPLKKRAIKALAEIVDAPSGVLWTLSNDASMFRAVAGWNVPLNSASVGVDASLPRFLANTGWIVDVTEYEEDPTRYDGLDLATGHLGLENARFIVPLVSDLDLVGFVVLANPPNEARLDYEDLDLLKAAGQQIASYIAQDAATELLAQSKQFEAFNKLTAYLMHDLKNVLAQQALLVENAKKHRDSPEFIDDAIETIDSGVSRMKRVIEQLKQGAPRESLENVEVGKLILAAASQCADREPVPRASVGEHQVWVRADRDRLLMAVCHAIRNAQEATPATGEVSIELRDGDAECQITVTDNGAGMDQHFVEERLFKPFDSTKGTEGMGIGAHQVRETIRRMGGSVAVDSRPGEGTVFNFSLPKRVSGMAAKT